MFVGRLNEPKTLNTVKTDELASAAHERHEPRSDRRLRKRHVQGCAVIGFLDKPLTSENC